jgi:hypothetical protein
MKDTTLKVTIPWSGLTVVATELLSKGCPCIVPTPTTTITVHSIRKDTITRAIPTTIATTTQTTTIVTTSEVPKNYKLIQGPQDGCWQSFDSGFTGFYAQGKFSGANYTEAQVRNNCFVMCDMANNDSRDISTGYRCEDVYIWYDTTVDNWYCDL